ncbi:uncharacterized protein LOC126744621 [Anthonomus grandis grandis]|uniref:uncharacterized protein LOC126744621 n=1 Tax=Anthonomus grandis grandis TaxID=2921223 RepID=UPI002166159F|nr:uncharacterized protein LOC126744621 [Anthonomus grandis grandis]
MNNIAPFPDPESFGLTSQQKEILLKYFGTHPYLMLGRYSEVFSTEDSAVLWFQLSQKLNNTIPEITQRSWRHWQQLWSRFSQELPRKQYLTQHEFHLLELLKRVKKLPFDDLFLSDLSQIMPTNRWQAILNCEEKLKKAEHKSSEDLNKVDDKETGLHSPTVEATKLPTLRCLESSEINVNQSNEMIEMSEKSETVQNIPKSKPKSDNAKVEILSDEKKNAKRYISEEDPNALTEANLFPNDFTESDSTDVETNMVDRKPEIEEQMATLTTITQSSVSNSRLSFGSAATSSQGQAKSEPDNTHHKARISNIEKALIKKFIKSDVIKMKYLKRKLKMENEYHKRKLTLMRDLLFLKKRKVKVEERQATALMRISRYLHRLMQNPRLRPEIL